jgi:hypothetical protein
MSDYDDETWEGEGPTVEAAFENAWHHAKEKGARPGRFAARVVGVTAENPIHSYIVVIGPPE